MAGSWPTDNEIDTGLSCPLETKGVSSEWQSQCEEERSYILFYINDL